VVLEMTVDLRPQSHVRTVYPFDDTAGAVVANGVLGAVDHPYAVRSGERRQRTASDIDRAVVVAVMMTMMHPMMPPMMVDGGTGSRCHTKGEYTDEQYFIDSHIAPPCLTLLQGCCQAMASC
jgi:hypothetical protein